MKMKGPEATAYTQWQEHGYDVWNDAPCEPRKEIVTVKYRGKKIDIKMLKEVR